MIEALIKAAIGITIIGGGWVTVQMTWRKIFHGAALGDDALAGRLGCRGCGCHLQCKKDQSGAKR